MKGHSKWAGRQNPSHQESSGSISNHLNSFYQTDFPYLKQTEGSKKTTLEDWIEFKKNRHQISRKHLMKTDWLQSNFLTEQQELFKCVGFFSLNSIKIQFSFDILLNTKNNFATKKFLKTIRKIWLYQIYPHSISFKMGLKSSFHCISDEKSHAGFCAHALVELPPENAQSKKYCVPKTMCLGRRNWRHILFNFWRYFFIFIKITCNNLFL